ncbi:PP2C family protein-serine/threonine phosphatase [Evansella halocellulosilytica]|uniref:PP2C family protein-serine/threonine phosphatase n=1 Tax=Evansella halocellulosilytica TaxID=2011013 RepID=UPI000BB76257|nr:protein phosphatase 2C domain-containing protein [Evansella halocellulosilytica]
MRENRKWQIGLSTDEGPVKKRNEDDYVIQLSHSSRDEDVGLFAIADGMGGYEKGDEASRKAVTILSDWWEKRIKKMVLKGASYPELAQQLERIFQEINVELKGIGDKAGTTLSVLLLSRGKYMVIHVGDSRIYKLKGASFGFEDFLRNRGYTGKNTYLEEQQTEDLYTEMEMLQLTPDHSWVETQVRKGLMTKEEARTHRKRNVLTQCLGVVEKITPFIDIGEYEASDIFLLCSDGFHSMFSNQEISESIQGIGQESQDFQEMTDYLVNLSNFSGTRDNITVMLVRDLFHLKEVDHQKDHPLLSFLKRWSKVYE